MAQLTKFKNFPTSRGGQGVRHASQSGQYADSPPCIAQIGSAPRTLSQNYKAIDIHINSGGGDVFTGIAIYNALRTSQVDIRIYVDGIAASIAGIIALCGKPLYMSRYARLMIPTSRGGQLGHAPIARAARTIH